MGARTIVLNGGSQGEIMSRTIALFGAAIMLALLPAAGSVAGNSSEAAASKGIVITSFTAGFFDPNGKIPTLDGVPGAGVDNWDIAVPVAALHVGNFYTYQMTFHSISYSGNCKATYKLTQVQGTKTVTLDSGTIAPSFDCTGPSIWAYAVNSTKTIPNSPGPATLTGTLAIGGSKLTMKVPMIIK
jgi:hypothetical protein